MKKSLSIIRLIVNAVLALIITHILMLFVEPWMACTAGTFIFASGFIQKLQGFAFALQTEVWVEDIQESLYKNSMFVQNSTSHDGYVSNKIVHIPQSGGKPGVVVNRTQLPAVIAARTDTDFTYTLAEFTTDPILITNIDELQISYDKRKSVTGQNLMTLSEIVGDYCANIWGTPSNTSGNTSTIITTSGSSVSTALAPGATGNRLAVTLNDIIALAKKLDNDLVPQEGRILLMQNDMFWQLFGISEVVRASYNGFQSSPSVVASGVVAELMGFKIMKRQTVNVFAAANLTPKAVGAATATDDNLACLAWHPAFVAKALGAISVFADSGDNGEGKPEYFGILLSALVMFGAQQMRADNRGIASLVQHA